MRSDTRRNKQRLLRAVAEEVRENPGPLSLQNIAARAEVAVTSAYRYYASLDQLLSAYLHQLMEELAEFSASSPLSGPKLFEAVLSRWVDLVFEHGKVLVRLRSRSGYLERLDRQDPVIQTSLEIWERPLANLLDDQELADVPMRRALFLCNALTDPREVLDLHETEGMSASQITALVASAVKGSLRPHQRATHPQ
ncbi:TetR/AcrR family transcriptional regulator [Arthrobacter rhizosphaerae]|uniref:TetR/AcrR family transcriptional regulator n=1 Tax=Arthrobacter rhizosphaerae TaxID=2855490 RepID=UPI001FF3D382|nr:TetR/AcrR family transcriptional regulator [Arthrobacter rhizosphaerae]